MSISLLKAEATLKMCVWRGGGRCSVCSAVVIIIVVVVVVVLVLVLVLVVDDDVHEALRIFVRFGVQSLACVGGYVSREGACECVYVHACVRALRACVCD